MQQQQQQSPAVLVACSTEANITAWDLATGSQLGQFKTNASGRNRLCQLGHDYFAAAQNGKDAVYFWTWGKDQVHQRSFTQESLTALAASPNGAYLAAGGNSGSLYVWDTATGALLRSWPAHYKAVSCLVFSDTGGVLVSCGDDTLVCAWLLAEVLDVQRDNASAAAAAAMTTSRVEPLHTWSEHTLPVTCMHLGLGEGSAVLVTASLDRSIKVWSMATGQLLRSITLPAGVTSVTMDAGEHVLLAGCADGSIYEVSLVGAPQQQLLLPPQGLTCAMYIKDGQPVPSPDPRAGLYICNRAGQVVQAAIPPDHIAFQLGQVLSIQSGGLLRATPHYVRAAGVGGPAAAAAGGDDEDCQQQQQQQQPSAAAEGISRNTFAVFMQPELGVALNPPQGLEALGGLLCMDSGHWSPGMSFGEFADHTLNGYYQLPTESSRESDGDQGHVPGTPDYPPSAGKDVAPAAVHLAAAAAGRQFAQLLVSHD